MRDYFDHEEFSCQNWPELNDLCPLAKPVENTVKIAKLNCERAQKKFICFAYTQGVDAAKMVGILLPKNEREMARYGVTMRKINVLRELVIIHETAHLVCWQPIEDLVWLLDSIRWPVSLVIERRKGRNVIFWNNLEFIIRHKHQAILALLDKWKAERDLIIKETEMVQKETDEALRAVLRDFLEEWRKETSSPAETSSSKEETYSSNIPPRAKPIPQLMECVTCSKSEDPDFRVKLTQAFQRGFERELLHFLLFRDLEDEDN